MVPEGKARPPLGNCRGVAQFELRRFFFDGVILSEAVLQAERRTLRAQRGHAGGPLAIWRNRKSPSRIMPSSCGRSQPQVLLRQPRSAEDHETVSRRKRLRRKYLKRNALLPRGALTECGGRGRQISSPGFPRCSSNSPEHISRSRAPRIAPGLLRCALVGLVECQVLCANNSAHKTSLTMLG